MSWGGWGGGTAREGVWRVTWQGGLSSCWAAISTHHKICEEAEPGVGILSVPLAVVGGSLHSELEPWSSSAARCFPGEGFGTAGCAPAEQGFGSNSSPCPRCFAGTAGLAGQTRPPRPQGSAGKWVLSWLGAHHVSGVRAPPITLLLSEEGAAGTCHPCALQMGTKSLTLWVFVATWA